MIDIEGATYIPVLCVRPAEVNALRELPEHDKDAILPAIQLRPWMGAKEFSSALNKVQEVFGENRQWIANIDSTYESPAQKKDKETGKAIPPRQAIIDFKALKDPNNGYGNWCDFLEENPNLIPCLQLKDSSQFYNQLDRLAGLERGLVLHLESLGDVLDASQLSALNSVSGHNQILFIVDFRDIKNVPNLNVLIVEWIDSINKLQKAVPSSRIAISSTSFPSTFQNGKSEPIANKPIRERQLFDIAVETSKDNGWKIIYSDRGSTRINFKGGGGGPKFARIDYPTLDTWNFFRADEGREDYRPSDYCLVAQRCMNDDCWNSELHVWGTLMIERTAQGDAYGITSPAVSTAVRINIHLHNQLFYDKPDGLLDTDDEWID